MRPLAGDDAHGRPRTSDPDGLATFRLPPAPQMTYSLGDESAIGSPSQPPPVPHRRAKDHRAAPHPEQHPEQHPEHSKPRVPSHHDFERNKESTAARPSSSKGPLDNPRHEDYDPARLPSPFPRSTDTPSLSQPLTPVFLGTSGPASALSSISSRRNSLCLSDDFVPSCPPSMKDGEVAVEDDEDEHPGAHTGADADPAEGEASGSSMTDSGSAPQLVMPSIKMPSRRPFTDDGKRMGRLKVLVAGDSGVGKTSLIKAVVQACEHIVHVDPITPSAAGLVGSSSSSSSGIMSRSAQTVAGGGARQRGGRRASARESVAGTSQITEIYASTKPYPEWWSEVDDFRVLRRRKSLGDAVLDRNICFVDTPGYGSGSSSMDTITPVAEYIEAHLQRINSNSLSDGDLLNLLGGEGGVQVDAVFYLVSNRLRPVDIEYLRQLIPLTNIIILLAQTDLMSPSQVAASKAQIHSQLAEASIRLFSFSLPPSSGDHPDTNQGIYAISSAAGPDHDTMDASLLMSPDYVQPLIPTELAHLVSHVFTPNGVARLRHAVARKYVQWRNADASSSARPPSLARNHTLPAPSTTLSSFASFRTSTPDNNNNNTAPTPPVPGMGMGMGGMGTGGSSSYGPLARRLADHTQREERLAQVRLANWAADLQRSLAREREQYAALARGERAVWLAERIGECVREGGLVVANQEKNYDNNNRGEGLGCGGSGSPGERRRERHQYRRYRGGDGGRGEKGQYPGQDHGQGQSQQSQRHRQDPLGLLEVADELRLRGLVALEVLGSIGVLGGLALWVTRHYLHLQPPSYGWLAGEWERFWYGAR
ncbi:hypothetical protein C8A01DRAFT_50937 [Parachaetomium inaequale]|uniref:Septin-type G domain-containing protein n=1 Tax=Parachaetomium inaequale TaxID=2588326 RepID=A0AAN6PA23_9PEZI|nr:hypothetical protein C8A01DRAFT_50937 [Parachaetomium inaequale]